ncbi:zinc finger protein Xfin isoform X1 [Folsomia candida]|uniref:zinc finger protein Xfin isoform X1 n=2 Tax=Folsomia candida TaxID=158441 RepID=UPI000B901080|nr:zinc finger protein Xfin isoform X1 [Folsomia candida]
MRVIMPKEHGFSTFTKNGTGHILRDLLSSTVRLHRSNFVPPTHPLKLEEDYNSSPEIPSPSCSICTESGTNLHALAVQEMEILAKFVLNQEQISLILQTEDHPPVFCCKTCSSATLSLAKLTTEIENIPLSLRAVISSRNGLFNKVRNDSKVSELRKCSICSESGTNLRPIAIQEMEILAKFVLNQVQISLILQTEDHPPIFCCKICSSAILSLAKLTTQIENITISLRAVISSRNGLFNKLRKVNGNISELCHEIATNNVSPADTISTNDEAQLTGCFEEDVEFSIKVGPTSDHDDDDLGEITSDPPYHPESDDYHSDVAVANSHVLKYVCKICHPNATFLRWDTYKRHMKNKNIHPDVSDADIAAFQPHLESRKFACKICNKKFLKNSHLLKHLTSRRVHAAAFKETEDERPVPPPKRNHPFPCPKCDKSFTSLDGVRQHDRRSHEWRIPYRRKCTLCPKVFSTLAFLQRHMNKAHNVPTPQQETSHSCPICSKILATPESKQRHVESVHFPDKTSCPYGCQVKIDSEDEWVTHLEGCDSPKMRAESESACKYCPAVLRSMLLEIEHRLRVHPENTSLCPICEQRFTRKVVLKWHLCTITGNIGNTAPRKVINSEKSKFVCTICQPNVTFATSKAHVRHMRNKNIHPDIAAAHASQVKARLPSFRKFPCKKCGINFSRSDHLVQHMMNKNLHSDISQAGSMAKTGRDPLDEKDIPYLNLHMRSLHGATKRKCSLCPKQFTHGATLRVHMQQCHSLSVPNNRSRYPCEICTKTFATNAKVLLHVEVVHFSDKTSCPYGCEAKIDSVAAWVTHLEGCDSPKMNSESKFVCKFCYAVFRNTFLQMEHHVRQHPDQAFFCSVCRQGFIRQTALQTHAKNCKIINCNSLNN